ncbi:response regulator [Paenibacillus sp. strain BS8-2]
MYKLLVVDDEPTVRHGMRNYINWEQYGITFMGDADDGDTALEVIDQWTPDIVFTDVRMPIMDGITLSKEIKRRIPHIKIVFVSGHDDSEYLKSAMKVNAIDYILKPVNLQELHMVIERVVADLDAESKKRQMTQDMHSKLSESMPLLREKFMMSLINDRAWEPQRLQERMDFLGIKLPQSSSYWVMAVTVDNLVDIRECNSEYEWQLLSYAIQKLCQELKDRFFHGIFFEFREGEFVGLLYVDPEESLLQECRDGDEFEGFRAEVKEEHLVRLANEIRDNLQLWLKITVTIGIGGRVSELSSLKQSYSQAKQALESKWYLGKNQIYTLDSMETGDESYPVFDYDQRMEVTTILKGADTNQLSTLLDHLFRELARNRRYGFQYCRNVTMQIMLLAGQILLEFNLNEEDWDQGEVQRVERLFRLETIDELRQHLDSFLFDVCLKIREKRAGRADNLVNRVMEIVGLRYSDNNLSVNEIGKEVFLTDTYVSLLFKQETGQTVNEYITYYRIERAKEKLADPRQKMYDICYAVGYADPSYFSKLFKKITGLSPSTYRNLIQSGKLR